MALVCWVVGWQVWLTLHVVIPAAVGFILGWGSARGWRRYQRRRMRQIHPLRK